MKTQKIVGLFALLVSLSGMLFSDQTLAADPRNGAKLYALNCNSCHGARGQGSMPGMPDFRRSQTLFMVNSDLVRTIEQGKGMMPAFRGLLTTQEILDVIAHLRTFQ